MTKDHYTPDGTFSHVIENPDDPQHPSVGFTYPDEDARDELVEQLAILSVALMRGAEHSQSAQLKRVHILISQILGHVIKEPSQDHVAIASLLEFIWRPNGKTLTSAELALIRFGVASWYIKPDMFGDTSQRDFGMMLKESAQVECPHCSKSHWSKEMDKQRINQIVTEFRDKFGVQNTHMRSDSTRAHFRTVAAKRKPC